MELLRNRIGTVHIDFWCALEQENEELLQADEVVFQRLPLYTMEGELQFFPGTSHSTVAVDHFWDIARRLRAPVTQSTHTTTTVRCKAIQERRFRARGWTPEAQLLCTTLRSCYARKSAIVDSVMNAQVSSLDRPFKPDNSLLNLLSDFSAVCKMPWQFWLLMCLLCSAYAACTAPRAPFEFL